MSPAPAGCPVHPTVPDALVVAAPAPAQRVTPWFGIIGLMLLVTLLAAAFLQVRQHALLNLTVLYQDDYAVTNLYQLELEYLRLREALVQQQLEPDRPALQLRYDIFVSRVELLTSDRQRRILEHAAPSNPTVAGLEAFIAQADTYLAPGSTAPLSPRATQLMLAQLQALGEPVHQLMLDASHQVAIQATERQSQVRQHNLVGMALTGFLSCMVLVFAGIALHQLRALGDRHQRLAQLADELREARIEADSANQAKSDFLADMSHELRTPLHGLMGMLALLNEAPHHAQSPAWLATADESARHLLRLLDDILDLSKLESNTLELQPRQVPLAALVREVQALMQPAAHAKGLGLAVEIDPALPAAARLDPTRVRQVLFNLLTNAVKFSDSGSVTLRCWLEPPPPQAAGPGPWLRFDVVDTGIGMDADTVARLFRRFSRADDARTRHQTGAGLGLAISRNLARLMGGELTLRSVPGAGSVFSLRCPLVSAGEAPGGLPAAAARVGQPAPLPPSGGAAADAVAAGGAVSAGPAGGAVSAGPAGVGRQLRVLVADDHPVNRLVLQALLERLGHGCALVDNGFEALQRLRDQAFDLVLMDVHMPVMDGVAATTAIRALPGSGSRTLVVALTADVFADTRQRCLDAGADEVLTKPLSLPGLQALLTRRFGPASGASAEAAPSPVGSTAPLLDPVMLANVRELMGPDKAGMLYNGLFDQAFDALRRMRASVRLNDPEALKRSAHAVKGAALNLGLSALAEAAARLNRDALQLAPAALGELVQDYAHVLDASLQVCAEEGLVPPQEQALDVQSLAAADAPSTGPAPLSPGPSADGA